MSYFSDASLVYIPAAIKNGKTYSIKPTDGTGDLTFTRASSATRVGPNGLIEKVRTNYCRYSQDFVNGWSVLGSATRTGGVTDPNGGTTAVTISNIPSGNIADGIALYSNPMTIGAEPIIGSVWLKGSGTIAIALERGISGDYFFYVTDVTLTSTWTRYGIGGALAGNRDGFTFYICNRTGTTATSVDVAFAQVEQGDVATDYIATTTAAVSVGPVSGTPRLDYLGSDCGRLLLEPTRTNLVTYSEQLDNAAWTQAFLTSSVTANAATSPDGYTNADRISDTTAASAEFGRGQVFTSTANVPHTISVFLKAGTNNFATLRFYGNNINNYFTAIVDLSAGTITKTQAGTGASGTSATITNYGNGWYRVTATATINTNTYYNIVQLANSGTQTIGDFGNVFYSGSGTGNILAYGAMAELGAYPSSYIGPTLGTAVTRVADAAYKTGISSLIGQTEGTIFAEFTTSGLPAFDQYFFSLSDGTTTNIIYLGFYSTILVARVVNAGSLDCNINVGLSENTTYKIAFAYKANDCKVYINGVDSGSDTSVSIPAISQFGINQIANVGAFKTKQALLFKTRLTNAQLAELTTL